MKRQPTGEKDLFKKLWKERPHKCIECNAFLGPVMRPIFFSHKISKGSAPSLRLDPENIDILCVRCHHTWEFGDKRSMKIWDEEEYMKLKKRDAENCK